jgi:hypothetical protein
MNVDLYNQRGNGKSYWMNLFGKLKVFQKHLSNPIFYIITLIISQNIIKLGETLEYYLFNI